MAGKHLVDMNEDGQEVLKALVAGIPAEVIVAEAGKQTESEIEDYIGKTFQELSPPLETLTLDIKNRSFYEPILEMASQTLTHLTLDIDIEIEEDKDQHLERLGKLIEMLPLLEDLIMEVGDGEEREGEISIKSRSLKELYISCEIPVSTVLCPKLEKLDIGFQSSRMAIHTLTQDGNNLEELDLTHEMRMWRSLA